MLPPEQAPQWSNQPGAQQPGQTPTLPAVISGSFDLDSLNSVAGPKTEKPGSGNILLFAMVGSGGNTQLANEPVVTARTSAGVYTVTYAKARRATNQIIIAKARGATITTAAISAASATGFTVTFAVGGVATDTEWDLLVLSGALSSTE